MTQIKNKIKVLVVIPHLHQGGAERQVNYLVENLDENRFEVHIGYFYNQDIFFKGLVARKNSHLIGNGDGKGLSTLRDFVRKVKKINPDIVHLYTQRGNFIGGVASYFLNIPILIFSMRSANNRPWNHVMYRLLRGRQNLTIVNSHGIRKELLGKAGYREKDILVIHNFLDTQKFQPIPHFDQQEARKKFKFPEHGLLIASIGRICSQKNQIATLRALALLRDQGMIPPDFHLLLIGKCYHSKYDQKVKKLIQALNLQSLCSIREPVEDVISLYQAVDGIFQPSKYEGLSNAVIESQACGTIAALSREGDNDHLVRAGETGISFSIKSDQTTAEGLKQLIHLCLNRELKEKVSRQARQEVVERFSVKRELEKYQNLYEELMQKFSGKLTKDFFPSQTDVLKT